HTVAGFGHDVVFKKIVLRIPNMDAAASRTALQFGSAEHLIPIDLVVGGIEKIDAEKDVPQLKVFDRVAVRAKQDPGIFADKVASARLDLQAGDRAVVGGDLDYAAFTGSLYRWTDNALDRQSFVDQQIFVVETPFDTDRISGFRSLDRSGDRLELFFGPDPQHLGLCRKCRKKYQ